MSEDCFKLWHTESLQGALNRLLDCRWAEPWEFMAKSYLGADSHLIRNSHPTNPVANDALGIKAVTSL